MSEFIDACHSYAEAWSELKHLPQCRYISRPIYKLVASHSNTIVATAAAFFLTDLIMHQMAPQAAICAASLGTLCSFSYSPYKAAGWMCLAIPVMISKYHS